MKLSNLFKYLEYISSLKTSTQQICCILIGFAEGNVKEKGEKIRNETDEK